MEIGDAGRMTKQEALTRVVLHARAQRRHARGPNMDCRYWMPDGRRCFLGCLLTEEEARWIGQRAGNGVRLFSGSGER